MMDITCGSRGDFRTLVLSGQFWRQEDMDLLEQYVSASIRTGRPRVILDLERLSFVNSRALGLFVRLHTWCGEAGGKLILFQPQSSVRDVIEVADFKSFMALAHTAGELDALIAAGGTEAASAPSTLS
jgi:anti-anti-sigma factor